MRIKVSKIFKKYMKPYLEEKGFIAKDMKSGVYDFRFKDNESIKIIFDIGMWGNEISTRISRGKESGLISSFNITIFIDGPDKIDQIIRGDCWYYDTEDELIGVFEKQASILDDWVFDWLFRKIDINVGKIVEKNAEIRSELDKNSTEEKREKEFLRIKNELSEWKKTRFYPKRWKLENFDR